LGLLQQTSSQNQRQDQLDNQLIKTVEQVPKKYLKNITGTTLYEMRIISGTNIYRIFCFFDKGKLIVVLNGFLKKTNKTPKNEIKLALKLQKQYYDEQDKDY